MRHAAAALGVVGIVLIAGCGPGSAATHPPAKDILNRPDQSSLRDAHFTLTAHIATGSVTFDGTGDGLIQQKPQKAIHFRLQAVISGQSFTFEQIQVGGKEYDLAPDNPKWVEKPISGSAPNDFSGTNPRYLGEETLPTGKAWHVRATDASGTPFELWVRESDGYPLKYSTAEAASPSASASGGSSSGGQSTIVAVFDRFNTGETVKAPPASDVTSG
jgi:hypothetical protein